MSYRYPGFPRLARADRIELEERFTRGDAPCISDQRSPGRSQPYLLSLLSRVRIARALPQGPAPYPPEQNLWPRPAAPQIWG